MIEAIFLWLVVLAILRVATWVWYVESGSNLTFKYWREINWIGVIYSVVKQFGIGIFSAIIIWKCLLLLLPLS